VSSRFREWYEDFVLYMRSQLDHMALVTTGKALPVLLGRAPLPDRARYGWLRSAPPRR